MDSGGDMMLLDAEPWFSKYVSINTEIREVKMNAVIVFVQLTPQFRNYFILFASSNCIAKCSEK